MRAIVARGKATISPGASPRPESSRYPPAETTLGLAEQRLRGTQRAPAMLTDPVLGRMRGVLEPPVLAAAGGTASAASAQSAASDAVAKARVRAAAGAGEHASTAREQGRCLRCLLNGTAAGASR
jgi:hypothetical protein